MQSFHSYLRLTERHGMKVLQTIAAMAAQGGRFGFESARAIRIVPVLSGADAPRSPFATHALT
jgi:hypothetical protein